nr:alpha/beta hydrolase fold domain-containing protein [uncultured Acetatifactor sp.]
MKIVKNILFVVLCIVVFVLFYAIGSKGAMTKFANDKFKDLKTSWNGLVLKDLTYGDNPQNTYDLYLPEKTKENYSLILHIHGGGFYAGDKKEGEILCRYFASQGCVCASVNYPLMDSANASNINIIKVSQFVGLYLII